VLAVWRSLIDHLAVAAWAALTAVALLAPGADLPAVPRWLPQELTPVADKLVHFALFFVFALLVGRSLGRLSPSSGKRFLAWTAVSAYALALEVAQTVVPGRSWEWADLAATGVGLVSGWAISGLRSRLGGGGAVELSSRRDRL
jgi:VanZ family protein